MDFVKKEWQFRDIITEGELNRIEEGIEEGITKAEQADQKAQQAQQTADQTASDLGEHLNDYAINAVKTTGDWTMTGRLTFPSYELTNTELVIQHGPLIFPGNPNEKLDIEIPKASINGTLEISVISEWNIGNASGTITKVIHFSILDEGTIIFNNSYYSDVSPYTANHYAISDLIFDPIKDKFVVKIAHRSTTSTTVKIVVKARGTRDFPLSILKQITFSPIYTTDPTIYDQPYRTGVIVSSGSNANGHYVRWADGLQICWAGRSVINWPAQPTANTGLAYYASEFTWTFPASFIDTNIVITASPGYVGTDGSWGMTTIYQASVTTTSVMLRLWTTHSRPETSSGTAMAIGRWK